MKNPKPLERRKFTRFNVQIPLNLSPPKAKAGDLVKATSVNISMNGLYCAINRHVPLFDRLLVTFVSPKHNGIPTHILSQLEGIVVRVEPEEEEEGRTEYNIALYFPTLSAQQQELLYSLITSHIAISS